MRSLNNVGERTNTFLEELLWNLVVKEFCVAELFKAIEKAFAVVLLNVSCDGVKKNEDLSGAQFGDMSWYLLEGGHTAGRWLWSKGL